ncbi:MAG: hypothetical protein PHR41_09065 [Lactococcus chungangensis]|nr:hypothetical protein [Lactococcus chungangensis]
MQPSDLASAIEGLSLKSREIPVLKSKLEARIWCLQNTRLMQKADTAENNANALYEFLKPYVDSLPDTFDVASILSEIYEMVNGLAKTMIDSVMEEKRKNEEE